MGEAAEIQPIDTATTDAQDYAVVLCCARSVQGMVEEVGRNLRGIGFRTRVVCGAKARAELLVRERGSAGPTIYVVCVQGPLKEAVIKPLRQALASGRSHDHLFVAVLDLGLPLAMVGQIRRFAESLQRVPANDPTPSPHDERERRQWREQGLGRPKRTKARIWRARKRGENLSVANVNHTPPPRRPQTIVTQAVPAMVTGTTRYQAVTAAFPQSSPTPPAGDRTRAPRERPSQDAVPLAAPSQFGSRSTIRQLGPILAIMTVFLVAAGIAYYVGDRWVNREAPQSEPLTAATLNAPNADSRPPQSPPKRSTAPRDRASTVVNREKQPAPVAAMPTPVAAMPIADPTPELGDVSNAVIVVDDVSTLDAAAESRKLRQSKGYWVTPTIQKATTWKGARRVCRRYRLDGIGDWRLPFRRELKLFGAIGLLDDGHYWSWSTDRNDPARTFVYETKSATLKPQLKTGKRGSAVCVRKKHADPPEDG